jgi:hypothetical protein
MPFLRKKVHIVKGKLGDDAVALGAALLYVQKIKNNKEEN